MIIIYKYCQPSIRHENYHVDRAPQQQQQQQVRHFWNLNRIFFVFISTESKNSLGFQSLTVYYLVIGSSKSGLVHDEGTGSIFYIHVLGSISTSGRFRFVFEVDMLS